MKRLITLEDFTDVYVKLLQRGKDFILSKITFSNSSRTKSAFNESAVESSNWWIIPKVKERWNKMISNDSSIEYKDYFMRKYFSDSKDLSLLSLGSGSCHHEMHLATYNQFKEITCVDLAENRMDYARSKAKEKGLTNMEFIAKDLNNVDFKPEQFDIIYFHAALHHFEGVEDLLQNKLKQFLKPEGHIIINEYVGPDRMQFPKHQIQFINKCIKTVPIKYRVRFKTNLIKKKYRGSGLIRMIMADPSECVDSANILPALHKNFDVIEEKPFGGNILVYVLKDISHLFLNDNAQTNDILEKLFLLEDEYLQQNNSDFVFGIYSNK